jgi:hypothetical protein
MHGASFNPRAQEAYVADAALPEETSVRGDNERANTDTDANNGTTTSVNIDTGEHESPVLRRGAGSTMRAHLHGSDDAASPSQGALHELEGIARQLPPPLFEMDEHGMVRVESMPENVAILFRAAENLRLNPPAGVSFLAQYASATAVDVFQTTAMGTAAATATVVEELRASQDALLGIQRDYGGQWHDVDANTAGSAVRMYSAGAVIKNLIVSGALLYYKWPNTIPGAIKLTSFVAMELASAWANASVFQHVGAAKSASNEARRQRENPTPDPRLDAPPSDILPQEDPRAARIREDNKYALLETIHDKLTAIRREGSPPLPELDDVVKGLFIQFAMMALEQVVLR